MLVNAVICTLVILTGPSERMVGQFKGFETVPAKTEYGDDKLVNFCADFVAKGMPAVDCFRLVSDNACLYKGPVYNGYEQPGEAPGGGYVLDAQD